MAVWFARRASQNINANDGSTWNDKADGTGNWLTWANLAASDVLCANGNANLAINVDFTCLRISTAAEVGLSDTGAAGGGFTVSDARTITAKLLAGTTICLQVSKPGATYTLTLPGDIQGGTAANAQGINNSVAVNLVLSGLVTGGSESGAYGVNNSSTGAITGNWSATGGSSTGRAVVNSSTGTVTSGGGTMTGGTGTVAWAIYASAGLITLNNCNIINTATCNAVSGPCVYNPGAGNYIQYPAPAAATKKYALTIPHATVLSTATPDGVEAPVAGGYHAPDAAEVISTAVFGNDSGTAGTYHAPEVSEVLYGASVGATTGTLTLPNADGHTEDAGLVLSTAHYGPGNANVGTYHAYNATVGLSIYTDTIVNSITGNPVENVMVSAYSGVGGTGTLLRVALSTSAGVYTLYLPGGIYYCRFTHPLYTEQIKAVTVS